MNSKMKAISVLFLCLLLSVVVLACSKDNGGANEPPAPPPVDDSKKDDEAEGGEPESDVYESNGLPKNEEVTLKMGFFDAGHGHDHIDYAMETFMEAFPNVKFDVTYSPTMGDLVATKIAAKDDDDMFDLFNSNIVGGAVSVVENGLLESQEDLWDHEVYDLEGVTVKDALLDGTYETMGRTLGDTYNLPNYGTGAGLFYDKQLFEEKGWDQEPQTWSEFVDLLETIKQDGIIPLTYPGVHPGYIDNAFGNWKLFEIAEHNGNLEKFEDDFRNYRTPYYTSPEVMEAWNKIYDLGKKGYFPQGVAAIDHVQSQMQIVQRKAALVSTGSWVENEMKDSVPEGFEWGYMLVPMTEDPDQTRWTRLTAGGGFYIWANKPELNVKWAKEFNVWLLNLDIQAVTAEMAGTIPLRKDFLDDPSNADKLQPLIQSVLEYNANNKTRGESAYRDVSLTAPEASQASKVRTEAITEITEGKQDPKPILEEAERLLEIAISKQE